LSRNAVRSSHADLREAAYVADMVSSARCGQPCTADNDLRTNLAGR
jgi:hypothetical protein